LRELLANGTPVSIPCRTNSVGMRMRLIPPGVYWQGSPDDEPHRHNDEGPQRSVVVPPFRMAETPTTNAQYRLFRPGHEGGDNKPAVNVSWSDAVDYCEWLSKREGKEYRLPTEAEWEYACRAGTTTAYHFGDAITDKDACFAKKDGPYPVAQYKPNAFGLHDMHGNVWEWCEDVYDTEAYRREGETVDVSDFFAFCGAAVGTTSACTVSQRTATGMTWRGGTGILASASSVAEGEDSSDPTACCGAVAGSTGDSTADQLIATGIAHRSGIGTAASVSLVVEGEDSSDPTESSGAAAGSASTRTAA